MPLLLRADSVGGDSLSALHFGTGSCDVGEEKRAKVPAGGSPGTGRGCAGGKKEGEKAQDPAGGLSLSDQGMTHNR